MRVLTLNHWGRGGSWTDRAAVISEAIRELRPDLVAFQEAVTTDDYDSVAELVGPEFQVVHQTSGLLGDGNGAAVASRWPVRDLHEVDQQLTPRTADFPATTLIAEIDAPRPIGPLLCVNHLPSWKPQHEHERELQTVAAARRIEEIVGRRRMHVAPSNAAPSGGPQADVAGSVALAVIRVMLDPATKEVHESHRPRMVGRFAGRFRGE